MQNKIIKSFILLAIFFIAPHFASASSFLDFDNFPATASGSLPGSSTDAMWNYTESASYTGLGSPGTCGWYSQPGIYPGNPNDYEIFDAQPSGVHSSNQNTYGYLDIDNANSISGNSLRFTVTGGCMDGTCCGSELYNKGTYLSLLASKTNPVCATNEVLGNPTLFFLDETGATPGPAFPSAAAANYFSMYINHSSYVTNGSGGYDTPPNWTINLDPYNGFGLGGGGAHWYHRYYNQGGGWIHTIVDAHPQHVNTSPIYPYPGSAIRDQGQSYIQDIYRLEIDFLSSDGSYDGSGDSFPYSVWMDEMEFDNDTEPQNNETIDSPAVSYYNGSVAETRYELPQYFEISLNDKYQNGAADAANGAASYATYQVRYSFSPITDSNWSSAIPVHVIADPRYFIAARNDGLISRNALGYNAVWAPFTLAPGDLSMLQPGTMVYFAIKDVGQGDSAECASMSGCTNTNNDCQTPCMNCGVGYWGSNGINQCGRDYLNNGQYFDYAGDASALPLIKRIDYQIPDTENTSDTVSPAAPSGLSVL